MKVPARILRRVAGPLLASAALSCASPAPPAHHITPVVPLPPAEATSVEAPARVFYDARAEAERSARADALLASSELIRDARIEAQEAAARRRALTSPDRTLGLAPLVAIGCGRG